MSDQFSFTLSHFICCIAVALTQQTGFYSNTTLVHLTTYQELIVIYHATFSVVNIVQTNEYYNNVVEHNAKRELLFGGYE